MNCVCDEWHEAAMHISVFMTGAVLLPLESHRLGLTTSTTSKLLDKTLKTHIITNDSITI